MCLSHESGATEEPGPDLFCIQSRCPSQGQQTSPGGSCAGPLPGSGDSGAPPLGPGHHTDSLVNAPASPACSLLSVEARGCRGHTAPKAALGPLLPARRQPVWTSLVPPRSAQGNSSVIHQIVERHAGLPEGAMIQGTRDKPCHAHPPAAHPKWPAACEMLICRSSLCTLGIGHFQVQ